MKPRCSENPVIQKKRHLRYSSHVQAGTYAEDFSVSHSASSDGGSASMEESSPESGRTVS